jgi:hypothetical protein
MTAAAITTANYNPLTVQKSYAEYLYQLNQLTLCAWQITYTALWNTQQFSGEEIDKAKEYISIFLQQQQNCKAQYILFVQRVLLARQYISSHPGTYIPIPSQWFSTHNKNGFQGTESWLEAVQQTRKAQPLYKQAVKDFPEAVWQTIQTVTPACFHNWRSYFIQQNANGLLNLYLSTIANYFLSSK